MNKKLVVAVMGLMLSFSVWAEHDEEREAEPGCSISGQLLQKIRDQMPIIITQNIGGFFNPARAWVAIVDRKGRLCTAFQVGEAPPYARTIAISKAGTANGFSNDALALSTANLYSAAQPGGIIYGVDNTHPFNTKYLAQGSGIGQVQGGLVTAAGGIPLYRDGKVIGGIGLSGDSACADHVMAYRIRRNVGLDHIPAGLGYNGTDNIDYLAPGEAPNGFKTPHCFPQDIPSGSI